MLGIIIGTGAVILVTSLVDGSRQATMREMTAGTENVMRLQTKFSLESGRMGKITPEDIDRLAQLPSVESVMPELYSTISVRGTQGLAEAKLVGINTSSRETYGYSLLSGNFPEKEDIEARRRVCVIDQQFAKKLFGLEYPVGQRIRLEKTSLEVIGVINQPDWLTRMGKRGDLLIPYTTQLLLEKTEHLSVLELRAKEGQLDNLKRDLEERIQANPTQADLLEVVDPSTYLKDLDKWAKTFMIQVVLISGISLLVGGVGLMNVMLITVAERTKEIGLRKALGATSQAILKQFLVESALLSGLGGFIGVLLGYLASRSIEIISGGKIPSTVVPLFACGSVLFAVVLGIFAGLYPASKAANLSPVEALRYE